MDFAKPPAVSAGFGAGRVFSNPVFFNLYAVHDYYLCAVSPFVAVLVGAGIDQTITLWQTRSPRRRFVSAFARSFWQWPAACFCGLTPRQGISDRVLHNRLHPSDGRDRRERSTTRRWNRAGDLRRYKGKLGSVLSLLCPPKGHSHVAARAGNADAFAGSPARGPCGNQRTGAGSLCRCGEIVSFSSPATIFRFGKSRASSALQPSLDIGIDANQNARRFSSMANTFSKDVCVIGGGGHVGLPLAMTFAAAGCARSFTTRIRKPLTQFGKA